MPEPADFTEFANAHRDGMNQTLGLRFTAVTQERVAAEVPITPHLLQAYGIVHGGVYATIAETVCSVGAAVHAIPQGKHSVGLDNHTTFLRATRRGTLRAEATPVHTGRRTHLWQAELRDDEGRLVATARVRLMLLEPDASIGGEPVRLSDEAAPS